MIIKVYAFTTSTVTITRNGAPIANGVETVTQDDGHIFSIPSTGSYEINSTGFIGVYSYANSGSNRYYDPMPLMPLGNDLLGVPSSRAYVTSATNGNNFSAFHSDNQVDNLTVNAGTQRQVNPNGTSNLYRPASVRLRADAPISANSYADSNGVCSSPFVPVAQQKLKFAINVQSEWVAFASTNDNVVVTAYEPDGTTNPDGSINFNAPRTYNLNRVGTNNNTPTKGYETGIKFRAGTIFEGNKPFQAWYEPRTDTNAARRDETILFGWD